MQIYLTQRIDKEVLFGKVPVFSLVVRVRSHFVKFSLMSEWHFNCFRDFYCLCHKSGPLRYICRLIRFRPSHYHARGERQSWIPKLANYQIMF